MFIHLLLKILFEAFNVALSVGQMCRFSMSLIDIFTASISVLNSNHNLSKSVCNLTNPSETTCLRQFKEFSKSGIVHAIAAIACRNSHDFFGFWRTWTPFWFLPLSLAHKRRLNELLVYGTIFFLPSANYAENFGQEFAGSSTVTCARHGGHPSLLSS